MDAAGARTAGVSVSTLAKCVKDGGNRRRAGSGSGGGGVETDGAHVCLIPFLFLLLFLCSSAQQSSKLAEKRHMMGVHACDEHKLISDPSET